MAEKAPKPAAYSSVIRQPDAARTPAAEFDIPAGLLESELGISETRTCNAWAMDRVLAYLGCHSVDIVGGIAMSNEGKHVELVRAGGKLQLFDTL